MPPEVVVTQIVIEGETLVSARDLDAGHNLWISIWMGPAALRKLAADAIAQADRMGATP